MPLWICRECFEQFSAPRTAPWHPPPDCPGCGPGTRVKRIMPERERHDDDGMEYADPRDYRDGRE